MARVVTVNFGLVHEPPEFDYDFAFEDLDDDILDRLAGKHEDWQEILEGFDDEELLLLRWRICWKRMARLKQLPPLEFENMEKSIWGIRSGRGFGKTLAAANWLGIEACLFASQYAVVSPTHDDVRYTCFEGPTGLHACIPPQLIAVKNYSLPSITLWNGSFIRGFAGDTPERLRGPQHAKVWCDEIASWKYAQQAWDMLMFGLRLGDAPQVLWTGTPKPTPFINRLNKDPKGVVTIGSTYENRDNLTDFFYENIAKYEGTKVGRQELYGEILDPEEEGFVKRSQWRLWPAKQQLPRFQYVVLSLDTAFTERTHDKKEQTRDPTACSAWGVFTHKHGGKDVKNVLLLDCWEEYYGLPDLISRVKREMLLTYGDADEPLVKPLIGAPRMRAGHQGRKADLILIEEKGSGISLRQSLATENILTQGYNPGREDKLTRLHVVSPMWAHGRVWAVESEITQGEFKNWAEPLISQVCSYVGPGSTEHDDLLDTTTQALRLIMDKFFGPFTLPDTAEERERQEAKAKQERRQRTNPYDR